MILRHGRRRRYTTVDNACLEDERLSFRAVGLLAYLLSRPDGWNANYRHLVTVHSDGQRAVRSAMEELREHGYLEQHRRHDAESGTFVWECIIHEVAVDVDNPVDDVDNHGPCLPSARMDSARMQTARNSKDGRANTEQQSLSDVSGRASSSPEAEQEREIRVSPSRRPNDFDRWWAAYPRPEGYSDALRTWDLLAASTLPDIDVILTAVDAMILRLKTNNPGGDWARFAPAPTKWLKRGDYMSVMPGDQPARGPCAVCAVVEPCPERCRGPESGLIGSVDECVWA